MMRYNAVAQAIKKHFVYRQFTTDGYERSGVGALCVSASRSFCYRSQLGKFEKWAKNMLNN